MPNGQHPGRPGAVSSVVALEDATGIASATLRVWERRYGFPHPARDVRGGRVYDAAQVNKLRLIARLLPGGGRPGDLVTQSVAELQARLDAANTAPGATADPMLQLLKAMDHTGVVQQLLQQLTLLGLNRFVCEVIAPTNRLVGEAWACGQLEPREEHLYTESVQQVLRAAIAGLPIVNKDSRPRVVLATPAGEQHGLGLLMVEALLNEARCLCLPLGRSLPAEQVAAAARTWTADVIAVSATDVLPARLVLAFLQELRASLPAKVEIWVGGASRALSKPELSALGGLRRFGAISEVVEAVAGYRERR